MGEEKNKEEDTKKLITIDFSLRTFVKQRILDCIKAETAAGYGMMVEIILMIINYKGLKQKIINQIGQTKYDELWKDVNGWNSIIDEQIRFLHQDVKENRNKANPEFIEGLTLQYHKLSTQIVPIREGINHLFILVIENTNLRNIRVGERSLRDIILPATYSEANQTDELINPVDLSEEMV